MTLGAVDADCEGQRETTSGPADHSRHLRHLQGPWLAAMLYGSHARGTARAESDVDLLQVVASCPRSYSVGKINVTAYTPGHLIELAERGSLFIRHLRHEGLLLDDSGQILTAALEKYVAPSDYATLRREMAVVLEALTAAGAEQYCDGLIRLGVYAARTALYVSAAELGIETFDTGEIGQRLGLPALSALLRNATAEDLPQLRAMGLQLLDHRPTTGLPQDFEALAIWARDDHPMAGRLLEAVIVGNSSVNYTALTLPPA